MKCSQCGTENRDGARFCRACRTPLSLPPPLAASATAGQPTDSLPQATSPGSVAEQPTGPLPRAPAPSVDHLAQQPAQPQAIPPGPQPEGAERLLAQTDVPTPPPTPPQELSPRPMTPPSTAQAMAGALPVEKAPKRASRHAQSDTTTGETGPLGRPLAEFAPLPVGALIGKGRYVVLEVRKEGRNLNVYLVQDCVPVRRCPNSACGFISSDPQEEFCVKCGAQLQGSPAVHLQYLVKEAMDGQMLAVEGQLVEMKLTHPGLSLPHDYFSEAPYGSVRHYLALSEFLPQLANRLAPPQEILGVLDWGVQLATAMVYLHQNYVTLQVQPQQVLEHIEIEERTARWANLGGCYIIPPAARTIAEQRFTEDMRGLAAALFYLATGMWIYDPSVPLPPRAKDLFGRVMTSERGFPTAADLASALKEVLKELRRPTSVDLRVGRMSDVGAARQLNEDSLLTLELMQVCRSVTEPMGLYVVADGMGGHEAGDVASGLAVETVTRKMAVELLGAVSETKPDYGDWLKAATLAANEAVYHRRRAAGSDMGTTLVMALIVGDMAYVSNVGDSRAYRISDQGIRQITTDHSLVERLVVAGRITREEAARHDQRNIIYRSIGDKPRVEADVFVERLGVGDRVLLCSDGLSGMVPDMSIRQIVTTSLSPQEACIRLVEEANAAGGDDNITVIIVEVGGKP